MFGAVLVHCQRYSSSGYTTSRVHSPFENSKICHRLSSTSRLSVYSSVPVLCHRLFGTMNAPDRHERFVVPDGIKKVSYAKDTKIANAATVTLQREDHTMGNLIRMQLHRDPSVVFAGYRIPHPLQYKVEVKVQTTDESSPLDAYNKALNDLHKELNCLKKVFKKEVGDNDEPEPEPEPQAEVLEPTPEDDVCW